MRKRPIRFVPEGHMPLMAAYSDGLWFLTNKCRNTNIDVTGFEIP